MAPSKESHCALYARNLTFTFQIRPRSKKVQTRKEPLATPRGFPCQGTLVRGGEESRGIDHRDDLSSLTSLGVMTRSLSISKMAPSFLCWPQ